MHLENLDFFHNLGSVQESISSESKVLPPHFPCYNEYFPQNATSASNTTVSIRRERMGLIEFPVCPPLQAWAATLGCAFSRAVWIKDWSLCGLPSFLCAELHRYQLPSIKPGRLLHLRNHGSVPLFGPLLWSEQCGTVNPTPSLLTLPPFAWDSGRQLVWMTVGEKKGGPSGRTSSAATAGHTSAPNRDPEKINKKRFRTV